MAENKYYLTVGKEKRKPENDGYVAVITLGQPQKGDEKIIVLDVKVVQSAEEATAWFKQMMIELPWVRRN